MCMAPSPPAAPAQRNLLQAYGRTLDLDREADRLDYANLQRLEAEGRIDRWGRELDAEAPVPEPAPEQPAAPSEPERPRPADRGAAEARRRTARQARVAGRAPEVSAGNRLGGGNSAKKSLLGGP